jgi:hypothetical protein
MLSANKNHHGGQNSIHSRKAFYVCVTQGNSGYTCALINCVQFGFSLNWWLIENVQKHDWLVKIPH